MARKEKKYHFIYKTTNLLSGKYYYGLHSTNDLDDGYLGSGRRLRYSINKYGKENHKREIIEFCKNRKELICREREIVTLNEIAKEECMNLIVGGATKGHSLSTREKISLSKKGVPLSEKHKKSLSKSNAKYWLGKSRSDEVKLKVSIANKGKQYRLGHKHTEESRKKMSESHTGKTISEETRKKMSEINKGKKLSEKTRMKMSNSRMGNNNPSARKCIDTKTNIIYGSVKEMASELDINYKKIYYMITQSKNNRYKYIDNE